MCVHVCVCVCVCVRAHVCFNVNTSANNKADGADLRLVCGFKHFLGQGRNFLSLLYELALFVFQVRLELMLGAVGKRRELAAAASLQHKHTDKHRQTQRHTHHAIGELSDLSVHCFSLFLVTCRLVRIFLQ
jgi:hypothetical protein